jgi:cephalosporin hydroxylase
MRTLSEINQIGLEKFSKDDPCEFTDKGMSGYHSYIDFYDTHFKQFKNYASLLEIGVSHGASIWLYKEYFNDYSIVGVDMLPTWAWGEKQFHSELEQDKNITVHFNRSCHDTELWDSMLDATFDIVIDDGDHHADAQIKTFELVWPKLKIGGLYFIEDVSNQESIQMIVDAVSGPGRTIETYVGECIDDIIITIKKE